MPLSPDISTFANFSLAAYASLDSGEPDLKALTDAGFSSIQAEVFADTYRVVDIHTEPNGLSATVFERIDGTGERCLAIGGTDDLDDLLTDLVDIALLGTTALQSQYASLKTQVTAWINDGTLASNFTVTGHSLGGFLAIGIAADFSSKVSHAYLFNAPGVDGVLAPVLSALGVGTANTPDPSKISNIKASAGLSPIAGLGTQVSPPIWVEIEDQNAAGVSNPPVAFNHSQQVLTDALALHTLYATLDPTLSQDQLNALVDASGTSVDNTLESALDALRTLILGPNITATSVDRDVFYTNLYAPQNSGQTTI
jgi:hypothetical protein